MELFAGFFEALTGFWPYLLAVVKTFAILLRETWPVLLLLILAPMAAGLLRYHKQIEYGRGRKYVLLELQIPRETTKSPRGMEQVLRAIHSLRRAPGDAYEEYLAGETPEPTISLEMVSFGGEIHFYVRVPDRQVSLVESAFFSYYPDVELVQIEDYVARFPQSYAGLLEAGLDAFGTEYLLTKDAAYPIKSYLDFEAPEEGLQFDPISSLLEVLGKTPKGHTAALQFIITPSGPKWHEDWKEEVEKLRIVEQKDNVPQLKSPGQTETLKAVENNLTRPAFDTVIRFLLIGPASSSFKGAGFGFTFGAMLGALNQYSMQNLNGFRPNGKVTPHLKPHKSPLFRKTRIYLRTQRLVRNYFVRNTPEGTLTAKILTSHPLNFNTGSGSFDLTSTSLATLFHPPMMMVLVAPYVKRVEAKRAGPPAGLAIFGDESAIERFK